MPQSHTGLSEKQAQERLVRYGPNQIKESNRVTPLKILWRQIKGNFIIYLLIVSAVISFAVGKSETMYTLVAVVVVVIVFGFLQEYKAEKAVSALKNMLTPFSTVVRAGKEKQVSTLELVPGDILILRNGERVPADCAVIEQKSLSLNESILTGESKEIRKSVCQNAEKCTEDNIIFMGSFIVGGHCVAQVLHTGMNTKFGKIASLISSAEKELTLEKKVNSIGKYMVIAGIAVSMATGLLMFSRNPSLDWANLTSILILIVALSVSSFPEGLPVVLTTTLAVGAGRMAKQNAIVNRMGVIETLGEITVICSDKTGTLTTGKMTVKQIVCSDGTYDLDHLGDTTPSPTLQMLLKCCVLCNDATTDTGTPTEKALLEMAAKAKVFPEDFEEKRLEETPFSSERKMMSVLIAENTNRIVYAKGAPEVILNRCLLPQSDKEVIRSLAKEMSKNSYRTLALAYKQNGNVTAYTEDGFKFLGLLAMEDPPREEVSQAVKVARTAGIQVKMVTGDHIETALSIGRQIGLIGRAMEGAEIDDLSDEELVKVVESVAIFARVRPEHKLRIVKALKQAGHIVAMTGDGVNDAPALKEAHVGVAMGKNGTDVSRAAADITLKDDNFATIVSAIKEGRAVFNNIQKFTTFQLACNFAELLIIFVGALLTPILGWQVPIITAIQILFMNLVTDSIPAITLGFNPTSSDIMTAKPRGSNRILNRFTVVTLVYSGILMTVFSLLANYISLNYWGQSQAQAATTTMAALICVEVVSAFTFRSFRKPVLSRSPFVNMPLVWAALGSVAVTLLIIYTPLKGFFETSYIGVKNWLLIVGLCLGISVIYDLVKVVKPQPQHV